MPDLSLHKPAQRLRIYIAEGDRWRGRSLDVVLLETFREQGLAGATVFRASAGFGVHARIRTVAIEPLSMDLPVVIEVIDAPEKIAAAVNLIYPIVREGLITIEDVRIVKYSQRNINPLPPGLPVSAAMTRAVIAIPQDTPVAVIWQEMLDRRVKALPVVDADGKVTGIITDGDLLSRAGIRQRLSIAVRLEQAEVERELNDLAISPLPAGDLMTQPVVAISTSDLLVDAVKRMVDGGLKRLPVVDEQGRLAGMLSRLDVLRQVARLSQPPADGEVLPTGDIHSVADIMTANVPMVGQDEELPALVEKFAASGTHRLIVVDETGKAVGLVSDSDVVARVQPARRGNILDALRRIGQPAHGKETAYDLMSPVPLTAPATLPVVEAVQIMLADSRKWLVVVDEAGKPSGLVDRQILLEAIGKIAQTHK